MSTYKIIGYNLEPSTQKIGKAIQTSNLKLLMSVLSRKLSPTRLHTVELATTTLKWLNRISPDVAAPIRNHILDNLLSSKERGDMLRRDLSERMMEALRDIQVRAVDYRAGKISRFDLVGEILGQISKIGDKFQVIGWYKLKAGKDAVLPPDVKAHYESIMDRYGRAFETIKQEMLVTIPEELKSLQTAELRTHFERKINEFQPAISPAEVKLRVSSIEAEISAGDTRTLLGIIDYKAGKDVDAPMIDKWRGIIVDNLTEEGLEEPTKRSVLNAVAMTGKAIYIEDAQTTHYPQSAKAKKLKLVGINSYVIIPIIGSDKPAEINDDSNVDEVVGGFDRSLNEKRMNYPEEVKGAVHILIPNDEAKYPDLVRQKIEAASILINMAAKILVEAEHADLMATTEKMLVDFTEKLIGKEGAKHVYQKIIDRESTFIDGKSVERAILFLDIKGFTAITEAFQKSGLDKSFADLMNQFHTVAGSIITGNSGSINKFIGDAVLAVFPSQGPHIVDAAILLQEVMPQLNTHISQNFSKEIALIRESQPHFNPTLTLRIGLNTGTVTEGTIGASSEFYDMNEVLPKSAQSVERYEHGVLGRSVNEASRLESLGSYLGYYGVIMGQSTFQHVDADNYVLRELYPVKLIGSEDSQRLFAVVGHVDNVSSEMKQIVDAHNQAIAALFSGDTSKAEILFNSIQALHHDDALSLFYLKKIKTIDDTRFLNQNLLHNLKEGLFYDSYISILEELSRDADGNNSFARALAEFVARPLDRAHPSRVDKQKFEHLRNLLPLLITSIWEKDILGTQEILNKLSEYGDCSALARHFTAVFEGNGDALIGDFGQFFYPRHK